MNYFLQFVFYRYKESKDNFCVNDNLDRKNVELRNHERKYSIQRIYRMIPFSM